jgi:hypothetical protein
MKMTIRDPFQGYDQWKTASPYDEDCAADIELTNGIAERQALCPACGYHGNISVANWKVEVELAGFPGDLSHDEITFAGWSCEECGWEQEAIESDYERLNKYKESLEPRLKAVRQAIDNHDWLPAITLDDLFSWAGEGDFELLDPGEGDWDIECCGEKDCPTQWHKYLLTTDMGRENGKRWVTVSSIDADGDCSWDMSYDEREGDKPEDFEYLGQKIANQVDQHFICWAEYWLDCANTGLDPAEEMLTEPLTLVDAGMSWVEYCLDSAEGYVKYLKMGSER